LLDLTSELGEFAKEILKATDYGKKSLTKNHHMGMELGDLIYSLICLANSLNIDIETALSLAMEKYAKRLKHKGTASS